jgi:endonuclease/exonuclease/phosphatase family metal-dependent hydrolase
MRKSRQSLRVVTYNIHKCRGLDGRVRPGRIVDVLQKIDADIVALQEVVSIESSKEETDQARFIARELGFNLAFGVTRPFRTGRYGNVVMTRFPIHEDRHYDISTPGREPRGCLRTDIRMDSAILHVFNVHFGTAFAEQRQQARRLFEDRIVSGLDLSGHRIVLGDFNEWLHGGVSRTLRSHLKSADPRSNLLKSRSYPGILPLFNLDHIYFDRTLELQSLRIQRRGRALVASDHLPLVADFEMPRY